MLDTHTKSQSHFGKLFMIMNPPEKSFGEQRFDQKGKPRSPEKVSEKWFWGFRKTAPIMFYPKYRDAPPS